jgi:dihydroflavonol-4-reductase
MIVFSHANSFPASTYGVLFKNLRTRGFAVKVLMRPTADRTNIKGLDVEPVTGDMRDEASLTLALKGARYMFHVAADYRLWARSPKEPAEARSENSP